MRRFITFSPSQGVAQSIEKTDPVDANVSFKVSEAATADFDGILKAASKDESIGQRAETPADQVAVADPDGDLEGFTPIRESRLPSIKAGLRGGKVRQQVGPFFCVHRGLM